MTGLQAAQTAGASGEDEWALLDQLRARMGQKVRGRVNSCSPRELRHPSSPALGRHMGTPDSLDFRLSSRLIPSADCQAFRPGLNYTTGFPGSPGCRQQITELLAP